MPNPGGNVGPVLIKKKHRGKNKMISNMLDKFLVTELNMYIPAKRKEKPVGKEVN